LLSLLCIESCNAKGNNLVRYGQSVSNMITKLSEACQQYNIQELCDLFDHARSNYYYQSKDKPITDSTKKAT
jgi:hypothetical protein